MSSRSEELLHAATRALQEGGDPFSSAFLSEHSVRLNEALDLGQHIATIIEAYLSASPELRAQLMLALIASDHPALVSYAREFLYAQEVRKAMASETKNKERREHNAKRERTNGNAGI